MYILFLYCIVKYINLFYRLIYKYTTFLQLFFINMSGGKEASRYDPSKRNTTRYSL